MNTNFNTMTKTIIILSAILVLYAFGRAIQKSGHGIELTRTVDLSKEAQFFESDELMTILIAANRNGIEPGTDNWLILLAIRKAENGGEGKQFGIMNPKANDLDSQAGWCAATIMKNRERYEAIPDKTDNHSFIEFLGSRYCPVGASNDPDGLNVNWIGNVRHWIERLK
jgi:hypothetical protein